LKIECKKTKKIALYDIKQQQIDQKNKLYEPFAIV